MLTMIITMCNGWYIGFLMLWKLCCIFKADCVLLMECVGKALVTVCIEGRGGSLPIRTLPPWAVPVPRHQWWPGASSVGRGHVSAAEEDWDEHHLPFLPRPPPPALPAWDGAAEKLDPQQASPTYLHLTHSDSLFIWSVNTASFLVFCLLSFLL